MASSDSALHRALLALPRPHRKHLIAKIAKYPKGVKTADAKLAIVASKMPKDALSLYGGLYHEKGGVVDWRIDRSVQVTHDEIRLHLIEHVPRIIRGREPKLKENLPPQLHQIAPKFGRLDMTYVMWRKPQVVMNFYGNVTTSPPAFLRVDVRDVPFTIEMRHIARSRQVSLANTIAHDIGLKFLGTDLSNTTLCRVDSGPLQQRLETALGAVEVAVYWVGNGVDHLNFASVASDETISVRLQADYLAQVARYGNREESKRTWVFWTKHPDGYTEKAYYDVKLLKGAAKGEMTLSDEISDYAMQNLRRNVVAFF